MSEATEVPMICYDCGGTLTDDDAIWSSSLGIFSHINFSQCITSLNERLTLATQRAEWAEARRNVWEQRARMGVRERRALRVERDALRKDAARYRWLRDTLQNAKAGGGVEVNQERQFYETPKAGKEVRVYWYDLTPVGFLESEASTLDAAIDAAMAVQPTTGERK